MLTFLWCVPRSVSTAFEKMMWHSGEFEVISEPFLDLYKQSLLSDANRMEAGHRIAEICNDLLARSNDHRIFVKEMGYHAESFISDEFIKRTNHTFLIRDPRLSIPSLYKMRAEYSEDQPGFEGLLALFKRVKKISNLAPFLMDAKQLVSTPSEVVGAYLKYLGLPMRDEILTWPTGSFEAWKDRENWHLDAINSTGFKHKSIKVEVARLPAKVRHSIDLAMPFYLEMRQQIPKVENLVSN